MDKAIGSEHVPIAQKIPIERPEGKPYPIWAINFLLYHELSARFGIGEEEKDQDHNRLILMRHLNPDDPLTGFPGKIRFIAEYDMTRFELYEHIHLDDPALEFIGGPMRGGIWVHGRGNLMVDQLKAKFQIIHGLNLQSLATTLIGRIIEAAGEMVKNPKCTCEKFWTADR